ncbi:uncharacterized protein [Euphorbia lathyris]|uniref:uncharacterized protein isoform X2 n=1 Tax=Euphorbia lathyris TaxID=212925 RepID=UPI0033141933
MLLSNRFGQFRQLESCSLVALNHEDVYSSMERPIFLLDYAYIAGVYIGLWTNRTRKTFTMCAGWPAWIHSLGSRRSLSIC